MCGVERFTEEGGRDERLRDAKNAGDFVYEAEKVLGMPVEVIPGPLEADLVHLGVHARWPGLREKKSLIVDLGGGSAQFIYGHSGGIIERVSRPLGALRLKERFLKHDPPKASELRQMADYIDAKMSVVTERIQAKAIHHLIGTSATAAAVVCHHRLIDRTLRERADGQNVTLKEVKSFLGKISKMPLARRRQIYGVGWRRAEVIVPGVAVVAKILSGFRLPELRYSSAGIADGIIATFAMAKRNPERTGHERHHVFLSHNSADKPAVKEIALRLQERGIVPFLDEEDLLPGRRWRPALSEHIGNIPAAAVFIGPHGIGRTQEDEIKLLSDFPDRNRPLIPVLLPGAKKRLLSSALGEMTWVDFRKETPDPLEQLIRGLVPIPVLGRFEY